MERKGRTSSYNLVTTLALSPCCLPAIHTAPIQPIDLHSNRAGSMYFTQLLNFWQFLCQILIKFCMYSSGGGDDDGGGGVGIWNQIWHDSVQWRVSVSKWVFTFLHYLTSIPSYDQTHFISVVHLKYLSTRARLKVGRQTKYYLHNTHLSSCYILSLSSPLQWLVYI